MENCSKTLLCSIEKNLTCSFDLMCKCNLNWYYDIDLKICKIKKTYKSMCNNDNECSNDLNLICLNNSCSCSKYDYYWSNNLNECGNYTII